jgi:hypothetical protein
MGNKANKLVPTKSETLKPENNLQATPAPEIKTEPEPESGPKPGPEVTQAPKQRPRPGQEEYPDFQTTPTYETEYALAFSGITGTVDSLGYSVLNGHILELANSHNYSIFTSSTHEQVEYFKYERDLAIERHAKLKAFFDAHPNVPTNLSMYSKTETYLDINMEILTGAKIIEGNSARIITVLQSSLKYVNRMMDDLDKIKCDEEKRLKEVSELAEAIL